MTREHELMVADQRAASPKLSWLTLHAPELARDVRPGQYMLLRCAESEGSLLRRALYVASAEPAMGQLGFLYASADDLGLQWLRRARAGDKLHIIGPMGRVLPMQARNHTQLLLGEGQGLSALLFVAQQALKQQGSVTLLAAATEHDLLPPPFLLPDALEYQSAVGRSIELLRSAEPVQLIRWADSLTAALPFEQLSMLRDTIRDAKLRWERGFAHVLVERQLTCASAACGICAIETKRGMRLLCTQGRALDLRDV